MTNFVGMIVLLGFWVVLPVVVSYFSDSLYEHFTIPDGFYETINLAGTTIGRWSAALGISGYTDFLVFFFGLLFSFGIPIYVWAKLIAHPKRVIVYMAFIVFMSLALQLYV